MKKSLMEIAKKTNWILLGLLMLIAGLIKLFVMGPNAIVGLLNGFGFPVPVFFAWILIIGEIGSGALILSRWNLKYVVYVPMIILAVAAFAASWGNWPIFILQLVAVSNYWLLGQED